jgi:hypothetical protein
MRKIVYLIVTIGALGLFAREAAASHIQPISQQSAEAFCKGHGGGTDCNFCHGDHCHSITCNSKGCSNLVWTSRSGSASITPGGGGMKHGDSAPPKGNPPVRISSGPVTSSPARTK